MELVLLEIKLVTVATTALEILSKISSKLFVRLVLYK